MGVWMRLRQARETRHVIEAQLSAVSISPVKHAPLPLEKVWPRAAQFWQRVKDVPEESYLDDVAAHSRVHELLDAFDSLVLVITDPPEASPRRLYAPASFAPVVIELLERMPLEVYGLMTASGTQGLCIDRSSECMDSGVCDVLHLSAWGLTNTSA